MPPEKLKVSFSRLRICWKKSKAVLPHLGSTIQVKKSKAHPWGHSWQFSGPVAGSASLLLLLLYFCYTASFFICYTAFYVDFYFCIISATFLLPPQCLPPTSNNALLILRSLLLVVLSTVIDWSVSHQYACLTISHICAHNWSIMSCGPGLLFLLVQYGFLWKSEAGLLLLHSYCVPCVIVLVYLRVEWNWYCTSSLCQVYKPALSRVDLVRLTLLTMPDFGTNHKKRGRRHFWPNCQILKHWLRNWRGMTYSESVQRKWIQS